MGAKIQIKIESSKLLESFESFGSVEVGDEAGEFVTEGFDGVPLVVVVGGIVEALGNHLGMVVLDVVLVRVPIYYGGEDGIVAAQVDRAQGVGGGDHLLMELLSGTDAYLLHGEVGGDGLGDIGDLVGGDLRDEELSTEVVAECPHHQIDTFLEGDVEARHPHVGDGEFRGAFVAQLDEQGDDRSPRTHHIAIADHRETEVTGTLDVVGGNEELVAGQLGGTIEVDWGTGLVGGQGHDILDVAVDGGVDDVDGTIDIGLDALTGVVFGGVHLFDGCSVDHHVHTFTGPLQALAIADVADEVTKHGIVLFRVFLLHVVLFQLTAGVDDDLLNVGVVAENGLHEFVTEGTCAAGNEDGFSV